MHRRARPARIKSPLALLGLIGWFDASDLSTLSQDNAGVTPVATTADPVGRWMDKSGNNNHVTQATGSSKPAWTTGAQNSLPMLSFDGGDFLDMVATYNNYPLTIVGVAKTGATVGTNRGIVSNFHSTNQGAYVRFVVANTIAAAVGPTTVTRTSATAIGANTPVVFGARFDTIESAVLSNGVIVSGSHAASQLANIISIGRQNINNAGTALTGLLGELAIYNRALNNMELGQLSTYFNPKWGVY